MKYLEAGRHYQRLWNKLEQDLRISLELGAFEGQADRIGRIHDTTMSFSCADRSLLLGMETGYARQPGTDKLRVTLGLYTLYVTLVCQDAGECKCATKEQLNSR